MKVISYTPAPWSAIERGEANEAVIMGPRCARPVNPGDPLVREGEVTWLARIQFNGEQFSAMQTANLHAMAAGPEMLEALLMVVQRNRNTGGGPLGYKLDAVIDAAISKARWGRDDIRTSYDKPPIPTTSHDWSAILRGYDEGDPAGHGATEQEAVDDLLQQLEAA